MTATTTPSPAVPSLDAARRRVLWSVLAATAVLEAGNRYYRAIPGAWLALEIDLRKVTPEIRYEDPARQFPHIHGPLDRVAIVAVYAVERTADGTFSGFAPSPIIVRDPAS